MNVSSIQKERKSYIDIAKGILIIMVIIGHMQNVCKELNISDRVFETLDHIEWFWGPFFMPAFFIISGYCSNFEKKFFEFFKTNIRTLLLPAFTLGIFTKWLLFFSYRPFSWSAFLSLGIKGFLMTGGSFWFLEALFLSRLLYYGLSKYVCNKKWIFVIVFFFHIIGFYLFSASIIDNYWYFQHSLMLVMYLYIGQIFKSFSEYDMKQIPLVLNWVAYLLSILFLLFLGYESPHIAHNITIVIETMIPHLFLSVWGSVLIVLSSKKIKKSGIFEYFGKNSLIYYCFHINVLFIFINLFSVFSNNSVLYSTLYWIVVFFSTIIVCSVSSFILNLRFIRILLGKQF